MEPDLFLRGISWPASGDVPYPRADPADARRLPADTWGEARIPIGVRIEIAGDARQIDVSYHTSTDEMGYRGAGGGTTFTVWRNGQQVDERPAVLGSATVRLELGKSDERAIVYLPEGMKPEIIDIQPVDGSIQPASAQPRWVAYGDSIGAGWVATSPARGWVAIAGREQSLDAINLGYAGAARGETSSAEQISTLPSEVVTLSHGTNCWTMIPHSSDMMRSNTVAFVQILRSQMERIPILVVSPILRPDAEDTPNRLGATMAELRHAIEDAINSLDDPFVTLVGGRDLLAEDHLADGVHPNDDGHHVLASVLGPLVRHAHDHHAGPTA